MVVFAYSPEKAEDRQTFGLCLAHGRFRKFCCTCISIFARDFQLRQRSSLLQTADYAMLLELIHIYLRLRSSTLSAIRLNIYVLALFFADRSDKIF